MTPKAKEYEKGGYHVVEHERERNGIAGNLGYYIYFVTHLFQEPFYLAEWEGSHATAGTREDAINKLRVIISSRNKNNN